MIVLDTNVISELMRGEPAPSVLAWIDAQSPHTLWLTAVTVQELYFGVARLPAGKRRSRLTETVTAMLDEDFSGQIAAYDGEAAAIAGQLLARRAASGQPMPLADAQIASICLKLGVPLATRNTRDFAHTGIELINPWAAP